MIIFLLKKIFEIQHMAISTSQKLLLLQKKKEQLDKEIYGLKEKNMLILASSLTTIGELENIDMNVILGAILKVIKDIKNDEKEVLRNSGHSFLKKYKARISAHNKTDSKKE